MPRKAEPTIDLAIPIGTTAAAALLQMSAPKLIALTHQNVLHHMRDADGVPIGGKYLVNQLVADYVVYLTHHREHPRRDDYDEARARRALAAAQLSEMKAQKMSGELIEADLAFEAVDAMILRFRAKVMNVLPRIARECYGASSLANALERSENLAGEIFAELRSLKPEEFQRTGLRVLAGVRDEETAPG